MYANPLPSDPPETLVAVMPPVFFKVKVNFEIPASTANFNVGLGFNNIYGQRIFTAHSVFEPNRWENIGTYADREAVLSETGTYEWNRGLGEILQALIDAGFSVELIHEHQDAEWQAFPHMTRGDDDLYRLPPDESESLPLVFSVRARKML